MNDQHLFKAKKLYNYNYYNNNNKNLLLLMKMNQKLGIFSLKYQQQK